MAQGDKFPSLRKVLALAVLRIPAEWCLDTTPGEIRDCLGPNTHTQASSSLSACCLSALLGLQVISLSELIRHLYLSLLLFVSLCFSLLDFCLQTLRYCCLPVNHSLLSYTPVIKARRERNTKPSFLCGDWCDSLHLLHLRATFPQELSLRWPSCFLYMKTHLEGNLCQYYNPLSHS